METLSELLRASLWTRSLTPAQIARVLQQKLGERVERPASFLHGPVSSDLDLV